MSTRRQRSKSRKRPREWHHGRVAGEINDRMLRRVEPHYEAAAADRAEVDARTSQHRADMADWEECLDSAARSSPTALDPNMFDALG